MRTIFKTLSILSILFFTFIFGIIIGSFLIGRDGISPGDKIAIVNIDGIILDSKKYLKSFKSIKENHSIKGVVVRINSPGGAVGPSQEIYSELRNLSTYKPVVASMGSVAASGGYYIACAAEKIYANPGTITGSIGVIAQFANYEELLDWAKVDFEVIKSGKLKDVGSPLKKMSKEERQFIQSLIDNVHMQFAKVVSENRDIGMNKIRSLTDGRIFTGEQAKNLNLIDELGSLNVAVNEAAKLSNLEEDPQTIEFPEEKSPFLELLLSKSGFSSGILKNPVKTSFGLYYLVNITY